MSAKFYQVGGSVRDELLGLKSKDIDYAVEANSYDSMRQAILDKGGEIFLETPNYFTIRARVQGMGSCDFVLCRREGDYTDGRHPSSVEVGTIYDDLARRDFTINAIAKAEDGTIIDPHNGQWDLKHRMISCVGRTEDRFTEDGLRILRALRFAITKNFALDQKICKCLLDRDFFAPRLQGVSVERVREELSKCFAVNTLLTLRMFNTFPYVMTFLFDGRAFPALWLKPTLESK